MSLAEPLGLLLRTGLFGLMVIVCMAVGWLSVDGLRRPPAATQEPEPQSAPEQKPRPEAKPTKKRTESELPATPKMPETTVRPAAPKGPALTYERHVLPILERSCINCHMRAKKRGGLDVSTFAALMRGGDSGAIVKPGKPEESLLWESLANARMPPSGKKLPPEDLKMIRDWIASGARDR
jgi:hypothetical protein